MRRRTFLMSILAAAALRADSETACDTKWVERDFIVEAAGNPELERLARVEARIVNAEGKPEEAGPYLYIKHRAGLEASFFFAIKDSFHTLKPGQSKRLFIEAHWRTGAKGGVLLKTAFCR